MVTEDYVSFETAKLLKEKGFYQDFLSEITPVWKLNGNRTELAFYGDDNYPCETDEWYSAPILQMAMKWLREKGWFICIIPLAFYGEKASKFGYNIWADDNLEVDEFDTPVFYTYEDACNAAINYCLKYLN